MLLLILSNINIIVQSALVTHLLLIESNSVFALKHKYLTIV